MLPHYFIDRPVLAWVIAILIMIGGGLAITPPAGRGVSGHRAAAGVDQRRSIRARTPTPSSARSRRSSSSSSPASTG